MSRASIPTEELHGRQFVHCTDLYWTALAVQVGVVYANKFEAQVRSMREVAQMSNVSHDQIMFNITAVYNRIYWQAFGAQLPNMGLCRYTSRMPEE